MIPIVPAVIPESLVDLETKLEVSDSKTLIKKLRLHLNRTYYSKHEPGVKK